MSINPNPKIKYSIITEEKARKCFENGCRNIFYNIRPHKSCICDSYILWFNYDDDISEWEELDIFFGGNWWQLTDREFFARFGYEAKTETSSENSKTNIGSNVSNDNTIPDPWDEDKPPVHKDTSGFKLGDWMLENNPFYFTEKELKGFSASLDPTPRVKVTLPSVDTKMVGCPEPWSDSCYSEDQRKKLEAIDKFLSEPKKDKKQSTDKTKIVVNSSLNKADLDTLTSYINKVLDRKVPSTSILREQINYKITKMRYTESFAKDEVFDLINGLLLYCIDQGWNFNDQ